MTDNILEKELCDAFPNARPGFIRELVNCLQIHAAKNHDYTGSKTDNKDDLGLKASFLDIWRKVTRIKHMIWEETNPMVDESVLDNSRDLANYAILLAEKIKNEMDYIKE